MEVLPNAYIDRGSIVQMETKSKIKQSSLPELCSMHYNFIIFNFECTLFLSKFFKNKDHKVTVPKLYELPVFLRLIYDSLQRVKINNISRSEERRVGKECRTKTIFHFTDYLCPQYLQGR